MDQPKQFDWVNARNDCSLTKIFNQLELDARSDMNRRNELLGAEDKFKFDIVATTDTFRLFKDQRGRELNTVTFTLEGDAIIVSKLGNPIRKARLTLNLNGECMLKFDDDDRELLRWQFLKLTLENLFFAPKLS